MCFSFLIYVLFYSRRLFVILEAECVGYLDGPVEMAAAAPVAQHQAPPVAAAAPQYGAYGAQPSYGAPQSLPVAPQAQSYNSAPSAGYGSTKPAPAAAPSAYGAANNSRPVYKDENAGGSIMPISAINPYSSRFEICVGSLYSLRS
jgi:hypothetical protein